MEEQTAERGADASDGVNEASDGDEMRLVLIPVRRQARRAVADCEDIVSDDMRKCGGGSEEGKQAGPVEAAPRKGDRRGHLISA